MRILVSGSLGMVRGLIPQHRDRLGVILTPSNRNPVANVVKLGIPFGIDNGAFSSFDAAAFRCLLAKASGAPRLLWAVCPDSIADARGTLRLWGEWESVLRDGGFPRAFVLQDGQENHELPIAECYFVGGSTPWRLSLTAADVMREAKRRGAMLHFGRVNSMRRLRYAVEMGFDSADGSGYSRFDAVARRKGRRDMLLERHLEFLAAMEQQPTLF